MCVYVCIRVHVCNIVCVCVCVCVWVDARVVDDRSRPSHSRGAGADGEVDGPLPRGVDADKDNLLDRPRGHRCDRGSRRRGATMHVQSSPVQVR